MTIFVIFGNLLIIRFIRRGICNFVCFLIDKCIIEQLLIKSYYLLKPAINCFHNTYVSWMLSLTLWHLYKPRNAHVYCISVFLQRKWFNMCAMRIREHKSLNSVNLNSKLRPYYEINDKNVGSVWFDRLFLSLTGLVRVQQTETQPNFQSIPKNRIIGKIFFSAIHPLYFFTTLQNTFLHTTNIC